MRWDDRREKLFNHPLDGWWDRTDVAIQKAINCGKSTDQIYGDEFSKRKKVHRDILDEYVELALQHPIDKKAVIIGGLPSSGKTRYLELHCPDYAVVSSDMFKEILIERELVPDIETVTPLETGALCHAESAWLAKQFFFELIQLDVNIALDSTMNYPESIANRVKPMNKRGYFTEAICLDITKDESKKRVVDRHLDGVIRFLHGEGLGGRFLPLSYIKSSTPRQCFDLTKFLFQKSYLYNAAGVKPVLEGSW
jgi:hypothetical protein